MQFILWTSNELQLFSLINLVVLGNQLIELLVVLVWSISDYFLFLWA